MADEAPFDIKLAAWLGRAVGDSAPLLADLSFLTEVLGVQLPSTVLATPQVTGASQQAQVAANEVRVIAEELPNIIASGDAGEIVAKLIRLGKALSDFYASADALMSAVRSSVTPASVPDAAARAAAESFAERLVKAVSDYAIASAITDHYPQLAFALKIAGLLDWEFQHRDADHELSRAYVRKALRLDRIKDLIKAPAAHFRDTIGWGDPSFDPSGFFRVARDFFREEDDIEIGVQAGEPFLRACVLLRRDASASPPGLALTLMGDADADVQDRTPLNDAWDLVVAANLRMIGGVSARIAPPLTFKLKPLDGKITGEFSQFLERNEAARPFDILNGGGLVVVAANNAAAGVALRADWDETLRVATMNSLLFAKLQGATVRLDASNADGFIGSLLAGADVEGQFDLGVEWQADTGLRVTGSGGIEMALPIHRQLGPVDFDTLYLAVKIRDDGTLSLETSAALTAKLGPLTATADRLGALLDLRFAEGTDANFGPFDIALHFKPPTGVGLSIDAGMVKGGGYVYFDPDRGEYAGVLELAIAGIVTVKAIGLINTRMPDGSKGFALLIIITAEFGTGIQLGFGFTLVGLGGLLGLNRTMNLPPLAEGVRTGAVNSIMFPQNPVANAPRIISDLRIIFPVYQGRFLIGPMAKLGWGTPALVTASLGVIIEITGNIAIVGVLKVALPTADAPLIVIQANFIGAIEFDKQRLYFFAGLFESRIVFLTLEGELGLLVAWGPDANFVLSAGGFHPRFNPPPLPFPAPRRIAVSLLNTSLARIRTETYFAVTSNTVQFGSNTEVMFDVDVARVDGHLSFDALFRFSPFYFVIEVSASVSLKVFGVGLFSIHLHFDLSGPSPYRAHGTGSISFFFFDVSADFDITWGETQDTTLPPLPVMPLLQLEFAKAENWKAELPIQNNLLVSLRKLPETQSAQVLHPLGMLRVSQRAVPLGLKIDKVGSQKAADVNDIKLTAAAGLVSVGDAPEQFAKAQFLEMSDAQKLSQRAFDPLSGGLLLASGSQQLGASRLTKRRVRYEQIIIDTNYLRFRRRFKVFTRGFFDHFLKGGAVGKSTLSNHYKTQLDPFATKLKVVEKGFTVAHTENNLPFAAQAHFASEAQAQQYLDAQVAARPELHDALHVIPQYEAAA